MGDTNHELMLGTIAAKSSVFTTSMLNDDICNQFVSINSTGQVDEVSASASYMVAEAALPFSSPGHMRGLTLQRLFRKVSFSCSVLSGVV
jgi:hypothetical protein